MNIFITILQCIVVYLLVGIPVSIVFIRFIEPPSSAEDDWGFAAVLAWLLWPIVIVIGVCVAVGAFYKKFLFPAVRFLYLPTNIRKAPLKSKGG